MRACRQMTSFNFNDAVELRFGSQNEVTLRWSELTPTRDQSVALTFSGLGSSRSISIALMRRTPFFVHPCIIRVRARDSHTELCIR